MFKLSNSIVEYRFNNQPEFEIWLKLNSGLRERNFQAGQANGVRKIYSGHQRTKQRCHESWIYLKNPVWFNLFIAPQISMRHN
jgi:hypothetical protein